MIVVIYCSAIPNQFLQIIRAFLRRSVGVLLAAPANLTWRCLNSYTLPCLRGLPEESPYDFSPSDSLLPKNLRIARNFE